MHALQQELYSAFFYLFDNMMHELFMFMALLLFSGLSMLTNTKDEAKQLREDGWRDDEIEGLGVHCLYLAYNKFKEMSDEEKK